MRTKAAAKAVIVTGGEVTRFCFGVDQKLKMMYVVLFLQRFHLEQ